MKLGERIKSYRLAKKLTLKDIALKLGVSEATAQRYESGKITTIDYDKIIILSKLFDCSPSELMGWDIKEKNMESNEEAIFIEKFRKLSHDDQMLLLDNMDSLSDSLCLTSLEKKRINKCRQLSPDDVEDIDEMIDFKLDKALRKERAIQNAAI